MSNEYKELFCLITFDDQGGFYVVKTKPIKEPTIAEVCIPYKEGRTTYGITCYITNLDNDQLAIPETFALQEAAEVIFNTLTKTLPARLN